VAAGLLSLGLPRPKHDVPLGAIGVDGGD